MIPYAYERIFDLVSMRRLLSRNGFVIESFNNTGFLPYLPGLNVRRRNISLYAERLLQAVPALRWLAGIYTVVAVRV